MNVNLKGFANTFKRRRDWGGFWRLDGLYLNDAQARLFVRKAIAAGYEYDTDVPDALVREWLGLKKKEAAE